jgi:uncharacterized membrane protein YuzA (DUF378 family)
MASGKKAMKFWILSAVLGFASVISIFQVSTAKADEHKLNTVWIISGIICGLAALYCMWTAFQNSADGGGDQEK